MDATHKIETNEQHQTIAKSIMQKDPFVPSTIHQVAPQTSTQPWAVNIHNICSPILANHEHVQQFDEVVSTQQQW
jgi:hypothetical protein